MGSYSYLPEQQMLRFVNPIKLVISSPVSQFAQDMAQIFLKDGIKLGQSIVEIQSLEMASPQVKKNEIFVATLSPIVVYSTFKRGDGKKYTLYYKPDSSEFERLVLENLVRKARLIYGKGISFTETSIARSGRFRQQVVMYKGTIIKGVSGNFVLKGDLRLLQTAMDAGLGSKNSMGFGLIEMIQNSNGVRR
jgi:CRISPR-associated endoribonuclease Cas6